MLTILAFSSLQRKKHRIEYGIPQANLFPFAKITARKTMLVRSVSGLFGSETGI